MRYILIILLFFPVISFAQTKAIVRVGVDSTKFATRYWTSTQYQPIGSYLTSTPTLQQVTGAGNSTTDSVNVIAGNGDRVVSLYKENTGSDVGRIFIGAQSGTTRIILSNSGINFSNGTHESSLRFANLGQNNTLDFPDTSGNISVGVKLNGTTYMAGSNGVVNIGSVLTSIPTLAQVTAAGNSTTDSLIIKGAGNVVEIFNQGIFGPNKYGRQTFKSDFNVNKLDLDFSNILFTKSNSEVIKITTTDGVSTGSFDHTITIPDTSGTLSVGVKLNGTTYMAGSNGVVNIGSVLTSTPTLQQVTAAGNSTTDTINVKANNNTSVVQIYSDNSSTPKFGKVRLYRTLPSDYAEYSHESITYNVDGGFSKRLYWGASLPTQNRDYFFPDTSGNLSVGVKLNGTTYMAGSNGIADVGNYRRDGDTIALATFGAGAGLSTDTAAFQTTSVYGSFYHDGTDTLIITQMRIGLQGTSPNITTEVYWNDSLNVTAGATILVSGGTAATNTATGTNVTSFTNTKIPPGNWVWVRTSAVTTKPTYFSLTLIGYRKRK